VILQYILSTRELDELRPRARSQSVVFALARICRTRSRTSPQSLAPGRMLARAPVTQRPSRPRYGMVKAPRPRGHGSPHPPTLAAPVRREPRSRPAKGLLLHRLTKWSNSNAGWPDPSRFDQVVKPDFGTGQSRATSTEGWVLRGGGARNPTFTIRYQTKMFHDPWIKQDPQHLILPGGKRPPSGPGVAPGGRRVGRLYASKERITRRRRRPSSPKQPRS